MKQGKFQEKPSRMPLWYYAAVLILLGIFGTSIWYLASYYIGSRQQSQDFDEMAALVDSIRVPVVETLPQESDPAHAPTDEDGFPMLQPSKLPTRFQDIHNEDGILQEYAELSEQNPDMAGWLSIEDTRINYPVMHTPDRPNYYLRRNFEGKSRTCGCLYAREECSITDPSDNITIYGHNMRDGSMFAALHSYARKEFWEAHRYIRFDTLTEHHTYEIFAVFRTTASQGEGFPYHNFINAPTQEHFDTFVTNCLSLSFYDTGLVPVYGDKLICLSTCDYSLTNGRLVVAAVRIN